MSPVILPVLVLLPILGSLLIPVLPFKERNQRMVFVEALVLLNTILAIYTLFHAPQEGITLFRLTSNLSISLKLDAFGSVFMALISLLWPLATLYAIEYMKHEEHENVFFMFYTMTYGVAMGIALSEDVVTMYCFYEALTLVTLPLVMHTLTREAVLASRSYLYYSLGGAAFAFIGVIFILIYGTSPNFVAGGCLDLVKIGDNTNLLLMVYVLCFCGFSVKSAMFPFSGWLPKASVAPTPVTALLHAVAVVNAGAFAIMRVTYYNFGTEFLRGSWAQTVVLVPVIFTIVYGCSRALKETHFKRRLAWSTTSNLSYILFGAALMSPTGLVGALCHMVCHSVMKICAFLSAGSVIYKSGREYVFQLNGLGRKMPRVFVIFTIAGLALMGVPGLCGFISKWNLVKAAMASTNPLAIVGIVALLISALLTAIYMLTIVVRAFFPSKETDLKSTEEAEGASKKIVPYDEVTDPNWLMLVPLAIFAVAIIVLGLFPQPMINFFQEIAKDIY